MFPADNVWNTSIAALPVNAANNTWMASMNAGSTFLHPDFGPSGDPLNPYGIPFTVIPAGHPFVPVAFQYGDESDGGPYPLGSDTLIEGGPAAAGDRHAIMVDPSTCTLYELYDAQYSPSGSTAGSGAIWNLRSDALRPAGWTSADAAGLPILPGLVNYDEAASGSMNHAIRFTADCTQDAFLWPARHEAGQATPTCPPMGARFRLKASFTLAPTACSPMCQTVVATMKNYGLILADNGSNWYFQGTADIRWTDTDVDQLKQIPANAFEAVDESSLIVSPDSGQAVQPHLPAPPSPPKPAPAPRATPTTVSNVPTPQPVPPPSLSTTTSELPGPGLGVRNRAGGSSSGTVNPKGAAGKAALRKFPGAVGSDTKGLGALAWLALSLGTLAIAAGLPFVWTEAKGRRRRRLLATTHDESGE